MLTSCSWTPTTRKPHPILLRFARKTTRTRPAIHCTKLTGKAVRTEILELAPKYDHTIVDTGGRDTTSQRAALAVSNRADPQGHGTENTEAADMLGEIDNFCLFPLFPAALMLLQPYKL